MKLVAAAKLRRAQDAIVAARPYAHSLAEVTAEVAARAGGESHPLLQQRDPRRVAVVVITSDRGLCGGFNQQRVSCRPALGQRQNSAQRGRRDQLSGGGRKGRDFFRRRQASHEGDLPGPTGDTARPARQGSGRHAHRRFLEQPRGQRCPCLQPVPLHRLAEDHHRTPLAGSAQRGRPPAGRIFSTSPARTKFSTGFCPSTSRCKSTPPLLESIASEFWRAPNRHGKRHQERHRDDRPIDLQYNRARQAAITKELMEIVGGAEALKG